MKKTLFLLVLLISMFLVGCQKTVTPTAVTDTNTATDSYNSNNVSTMPTTTTPTDNQLLPPQKGDTVATIETDYGTIKFKLFTQGAPETSKNFVELAKAGKFDNVPFHRVIKDFMIQTGDFTKKNGTGGYSYKGPGTTIDNETSAALKHLKGTVSMANAGPDTNGSQFFIVTANDGTPFLDGKYSVFGQVYEGQDVADKISMVKTDSGDRPLSPILMTKVIITTL